MADPRKVNSEIAPTLIVHPNGVASVLSSPLAKALLNRGGIVMGIDAFQTGSAVAPRDTSNRAFGSFNQTNDANRVQDILTALEYLRSRSKAQTVNLVGLEAAGVWSYFARALAGGGVNLAADLVQFAADTDAEYVDKFFIPGLRRAGDFHAASVLNTQGRSLIYNASSQFPADWARQAAKAAGSEFDLRPGVVAEPDLVAWLIGTAPRVASHQLTAMKNIPAIVLVVSLLLSASPVAQDARTGIPAHDIRNTVLAGNTHYKMPVFATREAWLERAAFLRKQILASAGLLPMPEKRPLNAQVFGKLERDGYTVEKVLLETLPGFYLGGNLYRPRGRQGPFPGVVSPHGHWHYGRLENTALVSVPGRAISFARQGYVVFTYDMVGQNDTNQVPHDWLDARQDLWNIGSSMGIHLWNSIRATDFLTSLPDVDPNRIAATGASGGGTQTFFLMAVDERIKVAAPVNMISATSQGGGCQTAANLRAGWPDFSNMVVGALMAPRPLILISNGGDWTVETPKEVFPAIQSIYRLLGVENNVTNVHFPQFIHNYNKESREAVYQFFNQHILNNPAPVAEPAFRVDFPHELLALHGRARPANAITGLDQLVENHIRDARAATERLQPRDATTLAAAREAFAERLTFSLLALRPKPAELLSEKSKRCRWASTC